MQASSQDSDDLASAFSRAVNERGLEGSLLRYRQPTHLLSPAAAVAAQMDALQRNEWPEPDSGVATAYEFTRPFMAEEMFIGGVAQRVRSWQAAEEWLTRQLFTQMMHATPYSLLLGCESWQPASPVVFPSERYPNRVVQAVHVVAAADALDSGTGRESGSLGQAGTWRLRRHTYTFCLERVDRGAYKGCWLTAGVRIGDYANM